MEVTRDFPVSAVQPPFFPNAWPISHANRHRTTSPLHPMRKVISSPMLHRPRILWGSCLQKIGRWKKHRRFHPSRLFCLPRILCLRRVPCGSARFPCPRSKRPGPLRHQIIKLSRKQCLSKAGWSQPPPRRVLLPKPTILLRLMKISRQLLLLPHKRFLPFLIPAWPATFRPRRSGVIYRTE